MPASQLVDHDHPRQVSQALQQSLEALLRHVGIPPMLNKDVQHSASLTVQSPLFVALYHTSPRSSFENSMLRLRNPGPLPNT
jgi:hypothetical protein